MGRFTLQCHVKCLQSHRVGCSTHFFKVGIGGVSCSYRVITTQPPWESLLVRRLGFSWIQIGFRPSSMFLALDSGLALYTLMPVGGSLGVCPSTCARSGEGLCLGLLGAQWGTVQEYGALSSLLTCVHPLYKHSVSCYSLLKT